MVIRNYNQVLWFLLLKDGVYRNPIPSLSISIFLPRHLFGPPEVFWFADRAAALTAVLSSVLKDRHFWPQGNLFGQRAGEGACWSHPYWWWQLFKRFNQTHWETYRAECPEAGNREAVPRCVLEGGHRTDKASPGLSQPNKTFLCNHWWPKEKFTFSKSSMQNENLPVPC